MKQFIIKSDQFHKTIFLLLKSQQCKETKSTLFFYLPVIGHHRAFVPSLCRVLILNKMLFRYGAMRLKEVYAEGVQCFTLTEPRHNPDSST